MMVGEVKFDRPRAYALFFLSCFALLARVRGRPTPLPCFMTTILPVRVHAMQHACTNTIDRSTMMHASMYVNHLRR